MNSSSSPSPQDESLKYKVKVGVVILNYNGWQDTLACVESVLASIDAPSWVVIVDNASTNDSVRWLRHWAVGNMEFALQELGAPKSCPKPLPLVEIPNGATPDIPSGSVVLLHNAENKGYFRVTRKSGGIIGI